MATHDYVIANASGAAVRADLNNALAAIVTNNSGSSEPGTTYSFQWWADTNASQLKLRNAANDDWVVIQELDGTMLMENGTVAAPGLAFASDLDTGFFRPAANQLAIATNGVERLEVGAAELVINDGGAAYDFRVEGDTEANLLVTDGSADSVGIGTASPGTLLELNSTAPYVTLRNTTEEDTEGGRESKLIFEGEQSGGEISTLAEIEALHDGTGDDQNGSLVFKTNDGSDGSTPTKRVTIDRNGSLLLGSQLDQIQTFGVTWPLAGEGQNALFGASFLTHSNDANGSWLVLGKSRGTTAGSTTIVQDDDHIGTVGFAPADGTDYVSSAGMIRCAVDGTPGANDTPGRLEFWTCADGTNAASERMRLDANGRLTIRGTNPGASRTYINGDQTVDTYGLTVNMAGIETTNAIAGNFFSTAGTNHPTNATSYSVQGQVAALAGKPMGGVIGIEQNSQYLISGYYTGSQSWAAYGAGSIYISGTYQGSDSRLKDVTGSLTGVLEKLKQITPINFTWKENTNQYKSGATGTQIGCIAQEVLPHFPEVVIEVDQHVAQVEGEKDTINQELGISYGVDYAKLTPILLAGLKEAVEKIETLEQRLSNAGIS
jgi:hypothetical protein